MIKDYYVYFHYVPGSTVPFYCGKGRGRRAFDTQNRSLHWNGVVKKYGLEVFIFKRGLTEYEAFALEKQLIKQYGRLDLGTGVLVNHTDGGKGQAGPKKLEVIEKARKKLLGKVCKKSTRDKISKANKGRKPTAYTILRVKEANLGKPQSEETRQKRSQNIKKLYKDKQFYDKMREIRTSESFRKKQAEKRIGTKLKEETKEKIRQRMLEIRSNQRKLLEEFIKNIAVVFSTHHINF